MIKKKFSPCIYLYNETAIRGLKDTTVVSNDPISLAKHYNDNFADELIILDMSTTDEEHDKALDIIKEICAICEIPVIGAGNVKRMEDVKKIIYAGCKKAVLNYSKDTNVAITQEVSEKFGKDKIIACINHIDEIENNKELLRDFVDELIVLDEAIISQVLKLESAILPITLSLPTEASLDKLIEIMGLDPICGITGNAVNDNADNIMELKRLCSENGIQMNALECAFTFSDFKLNSDGHVTVVVQDYKTDEVLMVAYMNEEAFDMTVKTGRMTYYSRSRNELWIKGDTSGHYQYVKSLTVDCDKDTLLAKVAQVGAACHTGNHSCFYTPILTTEYVEKNPLKVFDSVMATIMDRKEHPKQGSYTNYLFDKGIDKILKKLGEENTEIVIAAKNPNPNEIKYEISDYLYHLMVLMAQKGVTWEEISKDLANR